MDKRYCVYLHKKSDSGLTFYIGSGTINRAYARGGRTSEWYDIVKSYGYVVEIYKDNLTKKESLLLEQELIQSSTHLVNKTKRVAIPQCLVSIDFSEYVYYSETSPSGLRWKNTTFSGKHRTVTSTIKDQPCGTLTSKLSWKLSIDGKVYLAHRVIIALNQTLDADMVVDHINGNPFDNRLDNLRVVTHKINSRNRKLTRKSSAEKLGVSFVELLNGSKTNINYYYMAFAYTLCGKSINKKFSVKKHGLLPAFAMACQWREDKIKELNEQGAGYTERHGT